MGEHKSVPGFSNFVIYKDGVLQNIKTGNFISVNDNGYAAISQNGRKKTINALRIWEELFPPKLGLFERLLLKLTS